MPHYLDGTEAHVGDVVRGKGYNLRDETGDLKDVVGIVVGITPEAEVCNLTLLVPDGALGYFTTPRANRHGQDVVTGHVVTGTYEYGQTDHFTLVT